MDTPTDVGVSTHLSHDIPTVFLVHLDEDTHD
jgi:hypothetical protein